MSVISPRIVRIVLSSAAPPAAFSYPLNGVEELVLDIKSWTYESNLRNFLNSFLSVTPHSERVLRRVVVTCSCPQYQGHPTNAYKAGLYIIEPISKWPTSPEVILDEELRDACFCDLGNISKLYLLNTVFKFTKHFVSFVQTHARGFNVYKLLDFAHIYAPEPIFPMSFHTLLSRGTVTRLRDDVSIAKEIVTNWALPHANVSLDIFGAPLRLKLRRNVDCMNRYYSACALMFFVFTRQRKLSKDLCYFFIKCFLRPDDWRITTGPAAPACVRHLKYEYEDLLQLRADMATSPAQVIKRKRSQLEAQLLRIQKELTDLPREEKRLQIAHEQTVANCNRATEEFSDLAEQCKSILEGKQKRLKAKKAKQVKE